jgi:alkanesulfonate monooxygenase SsuD/methylene tetrahydromethanopterin reductase-like flavin-dependent oxidoreductase (luciferase family)
VNSTSPQTAPVPSLGAVFPARARPESLPEFARTVESVGLDELWLVEDCFLSGGLTMAATALAVTERIKVGIGLLPALMRNPALAAMEIATLARLHPGRFTVAIGHGVPSWMAQIGAAPKRRMAALEEVVTTIRALLRGETVTFDGSSVHLDAVVLENPPDVVPPIVIGTTGPRGLGLAGERADGFLLPEGCGPAMVEWAVDAAGGAEPSVSAEPGAPGGPAERVVYAWASVDDDADAARAALEPKLAHWLEGGLYPEPYRRAGVEDPEGPVDLGRLVGELTVHGDAPSCAGAIRRFAAAGATSLVLVPVGEDAAAQVGRLGTAVLPELTGAAA